MTTTVTQDSFGRLADGTEIERYTLRNDGGYTVSLMTYGATVLEIGAPDAQGTVRNITCGFATLAEYERETDAYFGRSVGRFANRIRGGKFTLDGTTYTLATNNGPNHLHGGVHGFSRRVFAATVVPNGVAFRYTSPDGEEGYPGTLEVCFEYTLTPAPANVLQLHITARVHGDRPTVLNLCNHNYYNLGGAGSGDIFDHEVQFVSDAYLPVDADCLVTGEVRPVDGTPFDFRTPQRLGPPLLAVKGDQPNGGFDHCFVIREHTRPCVRVVHRASGRYASSLGTAIQRGSLIFRGSVRGSRLHVNVRYP